MAQTYRKIKNPIQVLYFSKYTEIGPSSRYRIYQFRPYLQERGISCTVHPLFGAPYFRLMEARPKLLRYPAIAIYVLFAYVRRTFYLCSISITKMHLLIIEGQLFPYLPALVEQLILGFYRNVVIEFDDAVYLTPFHERKLPTLLQLSSAVIVGNKELAEYAKMYAKDVHIIPTVVDTSRFKPLVEDAGSRYCESVVGFTIVWIGLAYNFSYLNLLLPVLCKLQMKGNIRLRVISSRPPALPGVNVEFRPWSLACEVEALQDCQVGIMPLPDTKWARGKCGLKLLQYMAVGIPSVASPVGINKEIIADGENGFLASTEEEWYAKLVLLYQDSKLRAKLGQAARHTVEERYSLQIWGPRLAGLYQEIANKGKMIGPARSTAVAPPSS